MLAQINSNLSALFRLARKNQMIFIRPNHAIRVKEDLYLFQRHIGAYRIYIDEANRDLAIGIDGDEL